MKWGRFKWTSPCCNVAFRKRHDIYGLEIFYCMKCGNLVSILDMILTDGIMQKSMEEFIVDADAKGILDKINE